MTETSPSEEIRQLVLYMATSLVGHEEDVEAHAEQHGSMIHVNLRVPEPDMGKVIGKEGRIARAMRTLVTITSSRYNLHARLEIDA